MIKECLICAELSSNVPNMTCKHFICPECYVKLKTLNSKCNCPYCFKTLKRRK